MDGNTQVFDQIVRYQVFLERYKNGVVRRIRDFARELDLDLADQIQRRLDRMTVAERAAVAAAAPASTDRLKALRDYFADIEAAADVELRERLDDELGEVAEMRANRFARIASSSVSQRLSVPSVSRLAAIVRTQPFQGRVLREWSQDWSRARTRRVTQALRLGLAQGETTSDIVSRLRGTASRGFRDGILEASRRSAETIVRTAANHVVSEADRQTAIRNKQFIRAMVRTAILDSRTSQVCRVNDGREYDVDEINSVLPAHPNCRSFWTPAFIDQGDVPTDERYYDWLKRQPREIQVEAIGETKTRLIRQGGLDPASLGNAATGREYTIEELRQREAAAFDEASL